MSASTNHPLIGLREGLGAKYKSRAKFAALADVDQTTIWAIEERNRPVGFEVLFKLANATGKSMDELRELLGDQVTA